MKFHITNPLPWDSFKEEQRGRVARIDSATGLVSTKQSNESSDYQRTVSMTERMWSNSTDSLEINVLYSGTPNLCIKKSTPGSVWTRIKRIPLSPREKRDFFKNLF